MHVSFHLMKARKAQEICLHANGHILTWMCEAGAHVTFRHFWMMVDSMIVATGASWSCRCCRRSCRGAYSESWWCSIFELEKRTRIVFPDYRSGDLSSSCIWTFWASSWCSIFNRQKCSRIVFPEYRSGDLSSSWIWMFRVRL